MQLKGAALLADSGTIEGIAAGTGNLDRQRDVLAPGCFAGCVGKFADEGLLMAFHKWDEPAIGAVTAAEEVPGGVKFRAKFFEHDAAQSVRGYCQEMQANGRKVGVSIGFEVDPDSVSYHRDGESLAEAAQKEGLQVDDAVREYRGGCSLVRRVTELYEASVVTVPANPNAYAESVKDILGGSGAYAGLTLDGHVETALSVLRGALNRVREVKASRAAQGRALGERRMAEIDEIARMLVELKEAANPIDARRVALAVVEAQVALAGITK